MFSSRIKKLHDTLKKNGIDAFFISNFYNILYLTGFKTLTTDEREAFVLVTKKNTYLFTDARYIFTDPGIILKLIEPGKGLFFHLEAIIKEEEIQSIGIESEDLRVHEYEKLKTLFSSTKIISLERTMIKIRAIKEDEEIQNIQKACEITDKCLTEIIPTLVKGDTEKEIAFRIEKWIKEYEYNLAFDPIVAIDENSAIPHYNTKEGNGAIKNNSIILLDFGVKYNNYLSDITRMVFLNPTKEMIDAYAKLLEVQERIIGTIGKENDPKAIDIICRSSLKEKHLPDFPHSLGHGVGLEIHEYPKLSKMSDDTLVENHIVTVEPGVYFPNKWGMRIEDTVVVKKGRTDALTKFPKRPITLP